METYSVGERLFLQFEVENLQNKKDFTLCGADYALSVGKKTIRSRDTQDGTISYNGKKITVFFAPMEVGAHVLDIWYYVRVGDILAKEDFNGIVVPNDATECRTVRYILNVVR